MEDATPQPIAAEPVLQVVPQPIPPKKGPGLLLRMVILTVAILGAGGYFLYTQLRQPVEEAALTTPSLRTQESKPNQGFGAESPTPTPSATTPTITSSDSVTDIEKDLSGTTIESGNANEFDADLQGL